MQTAAADEAADPPAEGADPPETRRISRLMLFLAVVYSVEGVAQTEGVIAQPLRFYLKEVHGWSPVQLTAFITALNFPWMIKPLFGLVSDFVPVLGYRRRSYLVLSNLLAAVCYLAITQISAPGPLFVALLLTSYGMAIASTVCGAVLVEQGQQFNRSGAFVNQEWLWFNIAALTAALIGGALVQLLAPTAALQAAALLAAVAPLAAACGAWWLVAEERSRLDVRQLTRAAHGLLAGLRSRELWLLAGFLLCYYFSPGFNVPLYYHLTDNLQFPQAYIGVLGSFTAAGSIAGALVYRWWFSDLSAKRLLQLSIVLGAASAASYLLLLGELSAAILSFGYGVATMIALVATLALAVDFCPRHSEGFIFAALMSVTNLAMVLSDNAGSFLYEHVLQRQIAPLVLVSAAFTSLALLLVPLLRLADTPRGGASPQQPAAT